jgi:biopolymer transport protein ExbD
MIVPLARRHRSSEDNVLPLINVVFLLLIFFMIAGALTQAAPFDWRPARVQAAPHVPAPAEAGVAVAADGRIAFDGEPIEAEALRARIERWQSERAGGPPLVVRADAKAASEHLLAVIDTVRAAGVERVRLLASDQSDTSR